jgi:transposase
MTTSLSRSLLGSETSARCYLLQRMERTGCQCPRCNCIKLYFLADRRRRCAHCRYTFHEMTGRWINEGGLSCSAWLQLLRLFEDDVPTHQMEVTLKLAHNTVHHAVTVLRLAILAHMRDGDQILRDAQLMRCRTDAQPVRGGDLPVFGISEAEQRIAVELLPRLTPREVLGLPLKKVRRGNVVHTARLGNYDTVVFAAEPDITCETAAHFARSPVYIDGLDGFWRFASARLSRHFGIAPRRFPLYLKEAEFRYRHRQAEIFPMLVEFLCDLIPHPRGTARHAACEVA